MWYDSRIGSNQSASDKPVTRRLLTRQHSNARPITVAMLLCALLAQTVLGPLARSWAAQVTAFDVEIMASMCSQHGGGVPSKPDRDHCPQMQCCLASARQHVDDVAVIATDTPWLVAKLDAGLEMSWPVITVNRLERIVEKPQQARAPPA